MGRTFSDDLSDDAGNVFADLRTFGRSVTHLERGDPQLTTTLAALFVREPTQIDAERGKGLKTTAKLHVPEKTAPTLSEKDAWLIGEERWETQTNDGPIGGMILIHLVKRIGHSTTSDGRTRSGR